MYNEEVADELRTGSTGWQVLGVLTAIALILFWIYVFANRGSIRHVDEFADPAWLEAAEAVCAERQAAILDLPNAASAETPEQRGELVAAGTVELQAMVRGLRNLGLPTDAKGAELVPLWLNDYDVYIQDRETWTDILLTGDDPPFLISGNADGERITDLLETFAEVNNMPSCAPSGDA